jgi:hypothetical protein
VPSEALKMGYFTQFADAAFKPGPNGERLFYLYGPWSRPYILSDAATERRLRRKMLWFYSIAFTSVLLAAILFQQFSPKFFASIYFEIFTITILFIIITALKITFHSEIRRLTPASSRALSTFFDNVADKSSYIALSLRMVACLIFVGAGIAMIVAGRSTLNMSIAVAFFALCAIIVGLLMLRKRSRST